VQKKLALRRFVEGWGVGCGLDVRCDPANPGRVIVGPGYALSPCGEDIVVCTDVVHDLSGCCNVNDPCATDDANSEQETKYRAVDLYIRYREQQSTAVSRVLATCGCHESGGCEPERVVEGYEVYAVVPANSEDDPLAREARAWESDYRRCAEVVTKFVADFPDRVSDGTTAEWQRRARAWLIRWLDEHPEVSLCGWRTYLCSLGDAQLVELNDAKLVEILFEMVWACRRQVLARRCACPSPGDGVALARVWLRSTSNDGVVSCSVECIDAYPPYRRLVGPQRWPVLPGFVNVGPMLWQRKSLACEAIARSGLDASEKSPNLTLDRTVEQLAAWLTDDRLFLPCRATVVIDYLMDPCEARMDAKRDVDHNRVVKIAEYTSQETRASRRRSSRAPVT
jgi:hypothetical protein